MSSYEEDIESQNEELKTLLERSQLFQDLIEEEYIAINHGNIEVDMRIYDSYYKYPEKIVITEVMKEFATKLMKNPRIRKHYQFVIDELRDNITKEALNKDSP